MNNKVDGLMERLDEVFDEMDSDATVWLYQHNEKAQSIYQKMCTLKDDYSFLAKLEDNNDELHLTSKEHAVLRQFFQLKRQLDLMERRNLYLFGHSDAIRYLMKIGLLKEL